MPSGACVVRYEGARGVVWRVKWTDASGRQVQETVGREAEGFKRKDAEAVLRERLVNARNGYRKPERVTFESYSRTWFEEGKRRRSWKPRTLIAYDNVLGHLGAFFGPMPLGSIRPRHVAEYVRHALRSSAPKTVNLHLSVLHDVLKTARREELIDSNPAEGVERPKVVRRRWRILQPAEVGRVAKAFTDDQARLIFLTAMLTGLRRFELQALRWRDVSLVENTLRVRESKSEEGERLVALSPTLAEELWQHRRQSRFVGDDERVFCHPKRGSMIDHEWFATQFRKALKAAGITDYVRPFHDLRHSSLTNGAAAGENEIALMARAGHRNMATTKQYLHLAGVVFRDEAAALEKRLLGGTTLYRPEPTSDDLAEHETAQGAPAGVN